MNKQEQIDACKKALDAQRYILSVYRSSDSKRVAIQQIKILDTILLSLIKNILV